MSTPAPPAPAAPAVPTDVAGPTDEAPAELRLLKRAQVLALTGIGNSSLYKLISAGRFPPPRRVPGAPGIILWRADEVEAWIRALPESDPSDGPWHGRPSRRGGQS